MDPSVDDDFIPDEPGFITDEKPKTPAWVSASRGGLQGATGGFSDEAGGALQAFLQYHVNSLPAAWRGPLGLPREDQDIAQVYRDARDADRRRDEQAREQHPLAYGGGELAGTLATTALLPGGAAGKAAGGALARAGTAALRAAPAGAVSGLGHSTAESVPQAVADAATGAGGAALTAGALEGGAGVYRAGREALQRGAAGAAEAIEGKAAETIEAGIARARGAYGGEKQVGNRIIENLDRNAQAMSPAQQVRAALVRRDVDKLRSELIDANLRDVGAQSPVIAARKAELSRLLASESGDKAALAASLRESGPRMLLGSGRQSAMKSLLGYAVGGAGAAVGAAVGGPIGAAAGGASALAVAGALRAPEARLALAKWATSALEAGAVPARYAGILTKAASRGPEALASLHIALAQRDPNYLPSMQRVAETTGLE